jgi:hypothetical protein
MRLTALMLFFAGLFALTIGPKTTTAAAPETGFTPLFNGKDLTGWVNVNGAPGTFFVKDGEIITTGQPTGFLRTEKQYENFELELEWKHVEPTKMANSGLFVWGDPLPALGTPYTRGIEVQILANFHTDWATSDGDIFSIWGARCTPDRPHPTRKGLERCLPSEKRTKPPGQWNHYKIIANDGAIKLHVNGKEVSGVSQCNPRKGYLALESEGVECHFRNIRIKELPSTNPKPEEICDVARGEVNLFTGLNLDGWTGEAGSWKAAGGILRSTGTTPISTKESLGAGEIQFDWKVPAAGPAELELTIGQKKVAVKPAAGTKPGAWSRATVPLGKSGGTVTIPAVKGLELRSLYFRPAAQ